MTHESSSSCRHARLRGFDSEMRLIRFSVDLNAFHHSDGSLNESGRSRESAPQDPQQHANWELHHTQDLQLQLTQNIVQHDFDLAMHKGIHPQQWVNNMIALAQHGSTFNKDLIANFQVDIRAMDADPQHSRVTVLRRPVPIDPATVYPPLSVAEQPMPVVPQERFGVVREGMLTRSFDNGPSTVEWLGTRPQAAPDPPLIDPELQAVRRQNDLMEVSLKRRQSEDSLRSTHESLGREFGRQQKILESMNGRIREEEEALGREQAALIALAERSEFGDMHARAGTIPLRTGRIDKLRAQRQTLADAYQKVVTEVDDVSRKFEDERARAMRESRVVLPPLPEIPGFQNNIASHLVPAPTPPAFAQYWLGILQSPARLEQLVKSNGSFVQLRPIVATINDLYDQATDPSQRRLLDEGSRTINATLLRDRLHDITTRYLADAMPGWTASSPVIVSTDYHKQEWTLTLQDRGANRCTVALSSLIGMRDEEAAVRIRSVAVDGRAIDVYNGQPASAEIFGALLRQHAGATVNARSSSLNRMTQVNGDIAHEFMLALHDHYTVFPRNNGIHFVQRRNAGSNNPSDAFLALTFSSPVRIDGLFEGPQRERPYPLSDQLRGQPLTPERRKHIADFLRRLP